MSNKYIYINLDGFMRSMFQKIGVCAHVFKYYYLFWFFCIFFYFATTTKQHTQFLAVNCSITFCNHIIWVVEFQVELSNLSSENDCFLCGSWNMLLFIQSAFRIYEAIWSHVNVRDILFINFFFFFFIKLGLLTSFRGFSKFSSS